MTDVFSAWKSGRVIRKHTMDVARRENNAEHTWGMCVLCVRYAPHASSTFLGHIILHDAGEKAACDVPAHIGWEHPEIKAKVQKLEDDHICEVLEYEDSVEKFTGKLTPEEYAFLEILDRTEFVLSCLYEFMLGNRMVCRPIDRAYDRLIELAATIATESPWRLSVDSLIHDLRGLVDLRTARVDCGGL